MTFQGIFNKKSKYQKLSISNDCDFPSYRLSLINLILNPRLVTLIFKGSAYICDSLTEDQKATDVLHSECGGSEQRYPSLCEDASFGSAVFSSVYLKCAIIESYSGERGHSALCACASTSK